MEITNYNYKYNYEINFKEGHLNKIADCLSRMECHNNKLNPSISEENELQTTEVVHIEANRPFNLFKNQIILEEISSGSASIKIINIDSQSRKIIKAKNLMTIA